MDRGQTASNLNVLVCPMEWGLGHAARCVPIIRKLIEKDYRVIIGADGLPYAFLQKEFPELKFIRFPSNKIKYPSDRNMAMRMLLSIPGILRGIRSEHVLLKKIIAENDIDVVISDNRYGLWNKNIRTVFMTHQIMIKCPGYLKFFEIVLYKISRYFIVKYDECWIPDFEGEDNLSGDLSHKYPLPDNAYYIGPLSRFDKSSEFGVRSSEFNKKIDILIILSGPEPQRTLLENKLISEFKSIGRSLDKNIIILKGRPDKDEVIEVNNKIIIYSHAESSKLFDLIKSSEVVICRSGYSSIMDLALTGKKAIFIPTPGQTEQEYLAEYLYEKKMFYYCKQSEINLSEAFKRMDEFKGLKVEFKDDLLDNRIDKIRSWKLEAGS